MASCGTFAGERDDVSRDVRGRGASPDFPWVGPGQGELRLGSVVRLLARPSWAFQEEGVDLSQLHCGTRAVMVFFVHFSFLLTFVANHFTAFVL